MKIFWTLARRELAAFFCSITGYVIIAAVTLLIGLSFVMLMTQPGQRSVLHAGHGIVFQQLPVLGHCHSVGTDHNDAIVRPGKGGGNL